LTQRVSVWCFLTVHLSTLCGVREAWT